MRVVSRFMLLEDDRADNMEKEFKGELRILEEKHRKQIYDVSFSKTVKINEDCIPSLLDEISKYFNRSEFDSFKNSIIKIINDNGYILNIDTEKKTFWQKIKDRFKSGKQKQSPNL